MKQTFTILLLLFSTGLLFAQNKITFEVKEESGESLIGASVIIEGTTTGTITNNEGFARLENLPNGEIEFVISFVALKKRNYFIFSR